MNRTAWMLFGLLLVSNLAWWVTSRGPRAVAPTSVTPPAGDDSIALGRALARVEELEARLVAVPARASETRTPASTSPEAVSSAASSETRFDPREQRVNELIRAWCAEARQIESAARRENALAEIRAALLSDDPVVVLAALRAYIGVHDLGFDRAAFRPLVLPLLESEDAAVRAEATRALVSLLDEQADAALVLARLEDPAPDVRWWAARMLDQLEGPELESTTLRLLDDPETRVRRAVLWSVKPEQMEGPIGRRLVELCADPVLRDEIVSDCFTHIAEPRPAVIEIMLETALHGSSDAKMQVCQTLAFHTPEEAHPQVATAFLDLIADPTPGSHGVWAVRFLSNHGDASHLPVLEALAANPLATDGMRRDAREIIAAIRARSSS